MERIKQKLELINEKVKDTLQEFLKDIDVNIEWENYSSGKKEKKIFHEKKIVLPSNLKLSIFPLLILKLEKEIFGTQNSKERFERLSCYFEGIALYLKENLRYINSGKDMALFFISFFEKLSKKIKRELNLKNRELPSNELIEEFIFGENLYKKIKNNPELKYKKLSQFFNILSLLWQKQELGKESFFGQKILTQVEFNIESTIAETYVDFFNIFLEKASKEILNYPTKNINNFFKKIFNRFFGSKFNLETLKDKIGLSNVDVKNLDNNSKISILNNLSSVIRDEFEYAQFSGSLKFLFKEKKFNCVTASFLAGSVLKELNIDYSVVTLPEHSNLIILIDNELYLFDILAKNSLTPLKGVLKNEDEVKNYLREKTSKPLQLKFNQEKLDQLPQRMKIDYGVILNPPEGILNQLLDWLGAHLLLADNYKLAFKVISEAQKLNPLNVYNLIKIAKIYEIQNKYDQAIQFLNKALNYAPELSIIYYTLGTIYLKKNSFPVAEEYLKKAIKLEEKYQSVNPEITALYYHYLGEVYRLMENFDEAEKNYRKALELNFQLSASYYGLHFVYFWKRDYKQAEKCLLEASRYSRSSFYLVALGHFYEFFHDYPKAIKSFKKALKIENDSLEILKRLAKVYFLNNQFKKAYTLFKKIIEKNPNLAEAYYYLGKICLNLNKFNEARLHFEKFIHFGAKDIELTDFVKEVNDLLPQLSLIL